MENLYYSRLGKCIRFTKIGESHRNVSVVGKIVYLNLFCCYSGQNDLKILGRGCMKFSDLQLRKGAFHSFGVAE